MLDVQPVLDKLHELVAAQKRPFLAANLILSPSGDGAMAVEDVRTDEQLAAVDFEAESNMLDAVDKLAEGLREAVS